MGRRALITGITGQDGSYLAELLLEKGYEVHGLVRRSSVSTTERIAYILDRVHLHEGDLVDQDSLDSVVEVADPDEVYNLAAQSFVGTSWRNPVATAEITGLGALRMLNAVRDHGPGARFYQASSSEMFGNSGGVDQSESTPIRPRSPYGAAKAYAHHMAVNYRESYDMFVACGILFNHESERRGREFVTRKIARQAAEISYGLRKQFELGNLDAQRDWGYAPDYVEAMWRMLQRDRPDDYVIATGIGRTVGDFVEAAARAAGLTDWAVGLDWQLVRPAELDYLCGNAYKAAHLLNWRPTIPFEEWVRRMVDAEKAALGERAAA